MRRLGTRRRLGLASLAVLLALALLAPASAAAVPLPELPDLTPDIPGPADLVRAMFEFLLKTFLGIEVAIQRRVVDFLVAHPVYSDAARYPELGRLRAYVSAGGWAILSLTIAVAALRYWASGFTASGSYEAIQGIVRGAAAAAAMVVYPQVFEWLCVAGNLLTHALLEAPGVEGGLTRLLAAALVGSFAALGVGSIATVAAVVLLVLLWPVVWALCFALFAVLGQSAFSFEGEFGDELGKPFVTVATLWVAFKAPQLLARQAMLAGIAPPLGGGLARTVVYGRAGVGAAARFATSGAAAGVSGRFAAR